MKLYQKRDRLKSETVSHLSEAYRRLTEPRPLKGPDRFYHCYANAVNQIQEEAACSWETSFKLLSGATRFPVNVLLNWHSGFFDSVSDKLNPEPISDDEWRQLEHALVQMKDRGSTKIEIEY